MGFFSDIKDDIMGIGGDFIDATGDLLGGIGGAVGIGPGTDVGAAYVPNDASFLASPEYTNQINLMANEASQPFGPSLAQLMANREGQKIANQSASLMASQRGMNPALAAKMASQQGSAARAEMAGRGAELALREDQQNKEFRQNQRLSLLQAMEANRQAQINKEQITAGGIASNQQLQFQAEEGKKNRFGQFLGGAGNMMMLA